jgi:Domain of unknown function (DUF4214)
MIFRKKVEVAERDRGSAQLRKSEAFRREDAANATSADVHDHLRSIEHRLELLSRGQLELQRTLILQGRARAVSTSDLLFHYGRDFLKACYVHLLGRLPDPAGIATYEGKLRSGASRRSILLTIYDSDEARSRGVHIRRIGFLRLCEALSRLSQGALSGGEKKILHLGHLLRSDSSDFVVTCYREILGRQPDLYGLDHYSRKVTQGTAKCRVIGDLVYSAEGKQRRVRVPGLWWRYALASTLRPSGLHSSQSA